MQDTLAHFGLLNTKLTERFSHLAVTRSAVTAVCLVECALLNPFTYCEHQLPCRCFFAARRDRWCPELSVTAHAPLQRGVAIGTRNAWIGSRSVPPCLFHRGVSVLAVVAALLCVRPLHKVVRSAALTVLCCPFRLLSFRRAQATTLEDASFSNLASDRPLLRTQAYLLTLRLLAAISVVLWRSGGAR